MMSGDKEMFELIDALTLKRILRHDLPYLGGHYQKLKDLGYEDEYILDLFLKGLLNATFEDEPKLPYEEG